MLDIVALLLSLAAIFSFINDRHLHLQSTIGLMLLSLVFAVAFTVLSYFGIDFLHMKFTGLLSKIDFSQVVLQGVLCFLLFAGAKNISLSNLRQHRWDVITLAVFATIVATFVIGTLIYFIFNGLGVTISYLYALIFGSIISPTDPVAAIAILKSIGLPENIEIVIDGESQFNDGIGVVIFVTLTGIAFEKTNPSFIHISTLFIQEVFGGVGLGLVVSLIVHYCLTRTKSVITQVLITLAAVSANYTIALLVHVSGPIASVILGLIVGNISIVKIADAKSKEYINIFWEMINQVLNAVLFVLIGLIAFTIGVPSAATVFCSVIAIVCVLFGRYISIYCSMLVLRIEHKLKFKLRFALVNLFTWAGLRGALAVALVLSLPNDELKTMLLPLVYAVVAFSILVQGSTLKMFFPKDKLKQLGQATNK
ncbi:MAG: sodium:proton antiporter [Coxiellaceae bacterium]|nr:sodium:proton antiporter [Coxiellaceae bacterium]